MHGRSSLHEHQREQLVTLFEAGLRSRAAASRLHISRGAERKLERRWILHGKLCLVTSPSRRSYPFEVRKEVFERFLAGERVCLAHSLSGYG